MYRSEDLGRPRDRSLHRDVDDYLCKYPIHQRAVENPLIAGQFDIALTESIRCQVEWPQIFEARLTVRSDNNTNTTTDVILKPFQLSLLHPPGYQSRIRSLTDLAHNEA